MTFSERRTPSDLQAKGRSRLLIMVIALIVVALLTLNIWWRNFGQVTMAERHLRNGRAEEALSIANSELANFPEWHKALSIKARAHAALEQQKQAASTFETYPVQTRRDLAIWSRVLLAEQRWSDALPICEQRVAEDKKDGEALVDLAVCQVEQRQLDAANQTADRLRELAGYESHGEYFLGLLDRRVGNNYGAIEHWKRLVTINPAASGLPLPPASFFYELGKVCFENGNARQATAYLEQSLNLEAQLPTYILTAQAWSVLGDEKQAEEAWHCVWQLEKFNSEARQGFAELALARDDAKTAIKWLRPSESETTTADVAFLLQRAYTRTGDYEQSRYWQRRTSMLRRAERIESAINRMPGQTARTYWTSILTCYRLADAQRWEEAQGMTRLVMRYEPSPFLERLSAAIETKGTLPDLDDFFSKRDESETGR